MRRLFPYALIAAGVLLALAMIRGPRGSGGAPSVLLVIIVVGLLLLARRRGWEPSAGLRARTRKVFDVAFLAFFVVYAGGAILWLVTGLATATAEGFPSFHRSLHRIGGTQPATRVIGSVTAKNTRFVLTKVTLAGRGEVRFQLRNEDGDGHNFSIYREQTYRHPLFTGTVFTGPATVSYEFRLPPPGVYFFRCDPHPDTMTGVLVVRPGPVGGAILHTTAPGWLASIAGRTAEAAHAGQPAARVALQYLFSLVNVMLAIFLIRVRPRDAAARLLGIGMIGTAAVFNLQAHTTLTVLPVYVKFHDGLHILSGVSYLLALLVFPDGHLPRFSSRVWLKWPLRALSVVVFVIAGFILGFLHGNPSGYVAFFGIAIPVAGFLSQAVRYRHSTTAEERQQSKLLMWTLGLGFLTAIAFFVGIAILRKLQGAESTFGDLRQEVFGVFPALFLVIPITLVVVLLRRRLWDIEKVINRTLVYGTLAWMIAILYVAVVVGVSHAVGGGERANITLSIITTALVAVAFEPVRSRLQRIANILVYGRRATPYEVIAHFSDQMAGALDVEEVLPRMAEAAARGVGAERAQVRLFLPGGGEQFVTWPAGAQGERFDRDVVVLHQGEEVGQIAVAKPSGEPLTPAEETLLGDLAGQAGLAMRNVRLTVELQARLEEISAQAEELRASRHRIVTARDAERRRLERQIHDGAQQHLMAIGAEIREAQGLLDAEPERALGVLDDVGVTANETLQMLRDLARGIFPPLLTDRGLAAAIEAQVRKVPSPVTLEIADSVRDARFPQEAEAAAYFCCAEALVNATRHAPGAEITVRLERRGDWLEFSIEDRGPGFDAAGDFAGTGIQNMRDRLAALGGSLVVESAPGQGTRLTGRLPIEISATLEPVG